MSDKFTWMHSGQIGAPQMSGASGSNGQMLQVLDACLIDGFNPQTATTITKTATTVTLTFGVTHGYAERQLIAVSGATDAALNGKHRIISLTTNTITIDAVGVAVTIGTITTKIAPLGFESIFGSTDPLKRAYRSVNTQSTQTVLYLDMNLPTGNGYHATNPAKRAMVSLCEDMTTLGTQINSYTDVRNDYATNPNGSLFWHQARNRSKTTAVTTAKNSAWVVIGNGDYFYFLTEWTDDTKRGTGLRDLYAFGDVDTFGGLVDRYNCMWMGGVSANDTALPYHSFNGSRVGGSAPTPAHTQGFFISNYDGVGGLRDFVLTPDGRGSLTILTSSGNEVKGALLPNPSSSSLIGLPLYLVTQGCFRAKSPRINFLPHDIGLVNVVMDLTLNGDLLVCAMHVNTSNNAFYGYFAFDLGV